MKRKKYTKENLPEKICAACGRPMIWRKRWEKIWAEVKYCSERCRRNKKSSADEKTPPNADRTD